MPQILAVTTQGHYTEAQRDVLRADILRQLDSCDAVVLILPPGVQLQNTFLPAAALVLPGKVDDDAQWLAGAADARAGGFVGDPGAIGPREVQHVDVPDDAPAGIPPHVWLYRNMLTDLQALAPLGRDETNGQYAVAVDYLTEEQHRIPHVKAQLERMYLNDEIDGAVYFREGADVLGVAVDDPDTVAENEIVRRC